jgi:hypothetical protein
VKRPTWKMAAWVLGGAAAGFAYYHFIGCVSGTCPITSNPYISTGYGAVVGFLASGSISGSKEPEGTGQG